MQHRFLAIGCAPVHGIITVRAYIPMPNSYYHFLSLSSDLNFIEVAFRFDKLTTVSGNGC